jgi:FKBP-type peptidyl-prolyl cis-trans isomerase SlyD
MEITDRTFVAIDYKLTLDSGETIDQTTDGNTFGFIVGTGQVIKGLEDAIRGKKQGEQMNITIEPKDGYGEARADLVREIPRTNFPPDMEIQPGMPFQAQSPHGPVQFTVKAVNDETVTADFNHPLAGERLHFDITIQEVREPSLTEMSAMNAGGACDCDSNSSGTCGTCGGCG